MRSVAVRNALKSASIGSMVQIFDLKFCKFGKSRSAASGMYEYRIKLSSQFRIIWAYGANWTYVIRLGFLEVGVKAGYAAFRYCFENNSCIAQTGLGPCVRTVFYLNGCDGPFIRSYWNGDPC